MKYNLPTLLTLFTSAVLCTVLTLGLAFENKFTVCILMFIYAGLTAYLTLSLVEYGVRFIKAIIKKKTKTNEIKVRVKYQLKDHPTILHTQVFVANTLKDCIKQAILLANRFDYIILEIDQLTTED